MYIFTHAKFIYIFFINIYVHIHGRKTSIYEIYTFVYLPSNGKFLVETKYKNKNKNKNKFFNFSKRLLLRV